jgi:hypothetical protein
LRISDSAEGWCQRLLADQVSRELQELYQNAREVQQARRRDLRKAEDAGGGDLDAPAFRYSIEPGQNPEDPSEYGVRRRLELRQGWAENRVAIDELFDRQFDRLIVEFESMEEGFDDLVEKLEDIAEEQGDTVSDDDRARRVMYQRDDVTFTFDLRQRRLEIAFGHSGALDLVDAAQQYQLGIGRPSQMLPRPPSQVRRTKSAGVRQRKRLQAQADRIQIPCRFTEADRIVRAQQRDASR